MPTQNRRIATYLPPYIDNYLKSFKSERNIKGDSEALIAALSEYFQVSEEVAYPSSLNLLHRIEAIEERFGSLKNELFSELKGESEGELLDKIPGQLELIAEEEKLQTENLKVDSSDLNNELLCSSLSRTALSLRFGVKPNTISEAKGRYKNNPEKFAEWLQKRDPDGLAWRYKEDTQDYHLLVADSIDSESKSSIPSSLSPVEEVYLYDQAL
jgi:hypothetical protein